MTELPMSTPGVGISKSAVHCEYSMKRNVQKESKKPEGFQNLPYKVLVKIFSYFSEREICLLLRPVCRNWRKATYDSSLWKKFAFTGAVLPFNVICGLLRSSPRLRRLRLVRVPDVTIILRQVSRCNLYLADLTIRYCTVGKEDVIPTSTLRNLVSCCPYINRLDCQGTQFHSYRVFHDFAKLVFLRSLDIGMNRFLRIQDLSAIALNCRQLKEFKLNRLRIRSGQPVLTDIDAVLLFSHLRHTLHVLKFDVGSLRDTSFETLLECDQLRELTLNNAQHFTGEPLRMFPLRLLYLKKLKIRQGRNLNNEDICYLCNNYSEANCQLHTLDFTGCWRLRDEGVKCIVDACCGSLIHLSVRACKYLTNDSIDYIIQNCGKLEHLNIALTTKIDPDTLRQIPTTLPKLKVLIIDDDTDKPEVMQIVKSQLKDLEIFKCVSEFSKKEKFILL